MYNMQTAKYVPSMSCRTKLKSVFITNACMVMDMIDKFKSLPQGCQYALTVIDILMKYSWYILLHTKEADKVVHAYSFMYTLNLRGCMKFCYIMAQNLKASCLYKLPPI